MTDSVLGGYFQERENKRKDLRKRLFETLRNYSNITRITVEYDGYGDDGNVGNPRCYDNNDQEIEISDELTSVINDYIWYHLPEGFENNDGGYGTVSIDVKSQIAEFDHYDRYTAEDHNPFTDYPND